MAKARSWSHGKDEVHLIDELPNIDALNSAVDVKKFWTVTDASKEFGGNRGLALELLRLKGNDAPTKSQINGQMRNLQRYQQYEKTGIKNKNSFAPAKAIRNMINMIAGSKAAFNGITVTLDGMTSVANPDYKRKRFTQIALSGAAAISFMQKPSYEALAEAYNVGQFGVYGDADIKVQFN